MNDDDDDVRAPLTSREWVSLMRARANSLAIKPIGRPALQGEMPTTEYMEKCRPRPSAKKWLINAPSDVIAVYSQRIDDERFQYTVALGGRHWTAEYAIANWRQGIDPRVTPCIQITYEPYTEETVAVQADLLLSIKLGRKISWGDLPPYVCEVIRRYSK